MTEADSLVLVLVNGRAHRVAKGHALTHEEIALLAYPERKPSAWLTIVWRDENGVGGILKFDEAAPPARLGMKFSAYETSSA